MGPSSPYFDLDWIHSTWKLIEIRNYNRATMSVTDKLIPKVKAEEEDEEEDEDEDEEDLVDPADAIKEACKTEHCQSYLDKLEICNNRVDSKPNTEETCYEEILDFYHCLDHCASKQIFAKLK